MSSSVEVVLATYDGERFLEPFLQSLLDQDDHRFGILVRDDRSSDRTPDILRDWQPRFDGRMRLLLDGHATGSAKGNFAELMATTKADHVLFADQDDVWTADHVTRLGEMLLDAEDRHGSDRPVYAFTDLVPVDGDLEPLADSYFSYKRINPESSQSLAQTVICAPMLGCASGINRALLDLALPVPVAQVTGHDWWALLLAAAAGHVAYSDCRTAYYRLHGSNSSGQIETSARTYLSQSSRVARVRRGLDMRRKQALAVRDRLDPARHADAIGVLRRFDEVLGAGPVARRIGLVRGNYVYSDILRNAATLAFC